MIHSYVLATNPAWYKYSPSTLATVHAVAWAIDNGFELFDHMHGDFEYKNRLSDTVQGCKEFFFSRSVRGFIGQNLFIYKRALKNRIKKGDKTLKSHFSRLHARSH